ncbi:MAG: 5'/3'-nucleotidase SurE [Bacteroidales bacterium]|nr:5'/3'-nucleotidase SurE [Bacteroidales bacterium]MBR5777879.1 5'/3'-nucleotidase SurE [Bacteroidales bacterium]
MKPLILISNDDSVVAKGLKVLVDAVREFGDVVVMSTDLNASGKSHALTTNQPLRVRSVHSEPGLDIYACNGTPADCVKLAEAFFCSRKPSLVLSGINHGSNASINVIYSGTMGATIEASINGFPAVGFSLLNHSADADFAACVPIVKTIVADVLKNGLPEMTSLNVNIPNLPYSEIKGMRVCRQAKASWADSYEKRTDPNGRDYWWLTGEFICNDNAEDTDIWALDNGYVSIVPTRPDFTSHSAIEHLQQRYK